MNRFKQTWVVGLLFCLAVMGVRLSLHAAQPPIEKANWAVLRELGPGDTVLVALNGAQSFQGQFKTLTDDAIEVHLTGGDQAFPREKVFRVSTKVQSHRKRNALLGALVGAGAGLAIGAASDHGSGTKCGPNGPFLCGNMFPNLGKEILTPVGAIVGGVVGAVLPAGGWREIYRAR
ncbi:MAG: hypothetical protein ACYDA9_15615 [Terriglobia bacterium]